MSRIKLLIQPQNINRPYVTSQHDNRLTMTTTTTCNTRQDDIVTTARASLTTAGQLLHLDIVALRIFFGATLRILASCRHEIALDVPQCAPLLKKPMFHTMTAPLCNVRYTSHHVQTDIKQLNATTAAVGGWLHYQTKRYIDDTTNSRIIYCSYCCCTSTGPCSKVIEWKHVFWGFFGFWGSSLAKGFFIGDELFLSYVC